MKSPENPRRRGYTVSDLGQRQPTRHDGLHEKERRARTTRVVRFSLPYWGHMLRLW